MKKLLSFAVVLTGFLATPRVVACQIVEGDRIFASDLMAANRAFDTLDSKLVIARSPMPGVSRVFRPEELERIARVNSIVLKTPDELCFVRASEPLTIEKLAPALREALALDDAEIEILDYSRTAIPRGTLSFSRSGLLTSGLSSTSVWRGRVAYDQTRTVPVWVKVRVTAERSWVEAAQPIVSGTLIEASQVIIRKGPRFPIGIAPLGTMELAVGRKSSRSLRPGEPIFAAMLTSPREVERGDTVRVEVSSGGAHLEFDGVAQSSGHVGEFVLIKDLETTHSFKARVDQKGKVSITK